jgi:hypothetical protein
VQLKVRLTLIHKQLKLGGLKLASAREPHLHLEPHQVAGVMSSLRDSIIRGTPAPMAHAMGYCYNAPAGAQNLVTLLERFWDQCTGRSTALPAETEQILLWRRTRQLPQVVPTRTCNLKPI